ncbi:MAG TPA: RNB domain-containing ribonuclease, partial [Ideonella sp.]|nr:RNB domain-containing ribonuclease [Ideonella sp.]
SMLQNYLRALGAGLSISDDPKPAEFQQIAAATKDRADAAQIHMMLLRSMQQAIYTPANSGHFGLAYQAYTHFTSPIRRYPDLLVHRVIKAILQGKRYHLVTGELAQATPVRKGGKTAPKPQTAELEQWEAAGVHCSGNERRADEASRDVEAWLKCRYMREHLGEEFSGTVSAATSFGLFVTLDALYVDGLVHISELGGDYYRFDEARQELRGERSGLRYTVGSRVRIQVSRVDLDGRKIDFRMVHDNEEERPQGKGRPAPRGDGSAVDELASVGAADRGHKRAAKAAKSSKGGNAPAKGAGAKRSGAAPVRRKGAATSAGAGKTGKTSRGGGGR